MNILPYIHCKMFSRDGFVIIQKHLCSLSHETNKRVVYINFYVSVQFIFSSVMFQRSFRCGKGFQNHKKHSNTNDVARQCAGFLMISKKRKNFIL